MGGIKPRKVKRYIRGDFRVLAVVNAHPRDARVYFDEEPHKYYIDGDRRGYISTTTYIDGYLFDNPFPREEKLDGVVRKPLSDPYNKYVALIRREVLRMMQEGRFRKHMHTLEGLEHSQQEWRVPSDPITLRVVRLKLEAMCLSSDTSAPLDDFIAANASKEDYIRSELALLQDRVIGWLKDNVAKCRDALKEIIGAKWDADNQKSRDDGTAMHANIERYYNGLWYLREGNEWKHFARFELDFPDLVSRPYRTEWVIYDEELRIPGSIDMVYRDPNDPDALILYDWKRAKKIYTDPSDAYGKRGTAPGISDHLDDLNFWHYAFQLNIYRAIIEKNYGFRVSGMYILCLHPRQPSYERYHIERMDREIGLIFEQRRREVARWTEHPETSPDRERVFSHDEPFTLDTAEDDYTCMTCAQKRERGSITYRNVQCGHFVCAKCYLQRLGKRRLLLVCQQCCVAHKRSAHNNNPILRNLNLVQ